MVKIDLRSDTVTLPTPQMRRAMYEAELGDDVYGEDPTVNKLQEKVAEITGKNSALLVSSGTQGNLVSILTQSGRGDEIIVGDASHIYNYEGMGASSLGGVGMRAVHIEQNGSISDEAIEKAIQPTDAHKARSSMLCLENTSNVRGGRVVPVADMQRMSNLARRAGLRVHLDGARIFNAAVAEGKTVASMTACVDSVTFCLSKGLACPVGSIVVGGADFITEAHRWRKVLGSGMRQAGIIAAAGLVALDTMIDRLAEDHSNAKKLAFGLAEIPGIVLDPETVETNIVFLEIPGRNLDVVSAVLRDEGVYADCAGYRMRMVTHYGIDEEDVDFTLGIVNRVMADMR